MFLATLPIVAVNARGADEVVDAPLPPLEAASTMVVPDGFHVTLFAGEPDVRQPIAFCIDDRGRLWVAEAYNYPRHGTTPGDRILIFEDSDGDGRFDKRTVFYDQLNYVTGVEVGFGGAWVMSPPYFYFIPDRNGDDRPDGQPQVLLDGFGNFANAHNLANGLAWGPDGWLYGTHGRTNWSLPGKPGTPEAERVRFDGGVYRYHPVRHVWEPYSDGSTNPWGIDWNDYGEAFVCNCVDPHLFHVIPGAHYEPWRNRASSEFAYARIPSIADHLHFVGGTQVRLGLGTAAEDLAGGGHAHCGTMVYLGDTWPTQYRNTVFMHNIHGKRINNDILKRAGSGYTAGHGRDLLRSNDPWYMGVTLRYGPDGAVYSSDWSDTGECHSVRNTRRETGRIYKIQYGRSKAAPVDIARLEDRELVALQLHRNDWHVQHARRVLHERAAQGRDMAAVRRELHDMFRTQADVTRQLRALWALYVVGGLDDAFLMRQLGHDSEYVCSWAMRLLSEDKTPPAEALAHFRELAARGTSQFVRLYLASVMQRLPLADRWPIAEALASRAEDAEDQNIPLMLWYGIAPLVHEDLPRFVALAGAAKLPLVRRHIARRVAAIPENRAGLVLLAKQLASATSDTCADLLGGLLQGLEGRRNVEMPAGWPAAYAKLKAAPNPAVRERALQLALVFDDPEALAIVRSEAADRKCSETTRNRAIRTLVAKRAADLAPLLLDLVLDPATCRAALRGLAEYDDPATAATLLDNYAAFDAAARQDAVQTLASRAEWALALLNAVEAGRVPRTDVTGYTARQLLNLHDERVSDRVRSLWGEVRDTPEAKEKLIAEYREQLSPSALAKANRSAGRKLFEHNCANCHRLFDAGATIGPDITGAQRTNLDYLLENLVDPSAVVPHDFQMQVLETTSGRVVSGVVVAETNSAVTLQTVNEQVVVPADEIESRSALPVSMMPEGLLQPLTPAELIDLFAYLSGPSQVPLDDE